MSHFKNISGRMQKIHRKYDRYIFPVALLVGFVIDNITFSSIDLTTSGLLIFVYLVLIGVCIHLFHFADLSKYHKFVERHCIAWLPTVTQFLFGGVFSAFLVFFLRSAPFGISLIFIFLLVGVLIGSDVFRVRFLRVDAQMGMYFAGIFVYLFFALSVFLGQVGTVPFVASSVVSLFLISFFIFVLLPKTAMHFQSLRRRMYVSVFGIFILINALYFLNLIPPVPLVLKDVGVYHVVDHVGRDYVVVKEKEIEGGGIFYLSRQYDHLIKHRPGDRVYVYSSIYAPKNVRTKIYHLWKHYDEAREKWEMKSRVSFFMAGGRGGGYRGYSYQTALSAGAWQVDIVTEDGGLIGEVSFMIEIVPVVVPLVEETV